MLKTVTYSIKSSFTNKKAKFNISYISKSSFCPSSNFLFLKMVKRKSDKPPSHSVYLTNAEVVPDTILSMDIALHKRPKTVLFRMRPTFSWLCEALLRRWYPHRSLRRWGAAPCGTQGSTQPAEGRASAKDRRQDRGWNVHTARRPIRWEWTEEERVVGDEAEEGSRHVGTRKHFLAFTQKKTGTTGRCEQRCQPFLTHGLRELCADWVENRRKRWKEDIVGRPAGKLWQLLRF